MTTSNPNEFIVRNIKKGEPVGEFFAPQPKRIISAANDMVDSIRRRVG